MSQDQLKQIERIFAEYATKINQSTKQENSGLIRDMTNGLTKLSAEFKGFAEIVTNQLKDHEERIRKDEGWRIGTTYVVTFLVGVSGVSIWLITTSMKASIENVVDVKIDSLKAEVENIPKMIEDYYEVSIDNS